MMGAEPTRDLRALRNIGTRQFDICAMSHSGAVRAQNQDAWFTDAAQGLVLIADGVGGQGDGAWASLRAILLIRRYLSHAAVLQRPKSASERERAITRALRFTNRRMRQVAQEQGIQPSGTTIAGFWAPPGADGATAFNVGDSALFRIAAGRATKVTKDHSLYQLWVDGGKNGTEPSRRAIMQAIGISPEITPYQSSFLPENGEIYLVCTDGLTGALSLDDIVGLAKAGTAEVTTRNLLSAALHNLPRDNVTVAVCKVNYF